MVHRTLHALVIAVASALALAVCLSPFTAAAKPAAHKHRSATHGKQHHKRSARARRRHHRSHHKPKTTHRRYSIRKSNATDSKRVCVYSAHSISILQQFDALVGRDVNCVMVFNNASPDWAGWEKPWFTRNPLPDNNWTAWATAAGTNRQLIISQNLFPASENNLDWRTAGARGDYEPHAVALARNLVAAGLGNSVIRLSHEANGDWGPDNIGTTQTQFDQWKQFWRNTVIAMRSVPGANFSFDWCINAGYRPIPLSDFYPGNDVVDIVGIDAYDSGVPAGEPRWSTIYNRTDGIGDVVAFARAHGKPLSIPEWGVAPATTMLSGGDDPAYVDGIASVVRNNPVAYQSYFYKYEFATQLASGPGSLASYRRHFGAGGDSVGSADAGQPAPPAASSPPPTAPSAGAPQAPANAPVKRPAAKKKRTTRRHSRSHRRHRHRRVHRRHSRRHHARR
jgi:glycosyl hydrolase family 26